MSAAACDNMPQGSRKNLRYNFLIKYPPGSRNMNASQQFPILRSTLRVAIVGALAVAPLLTVDSAHACAACGCTLSTDWDTQGNTTKSGFTADISYSSVNQNQQRYGTGSASPTLINNQLAAGQEVEAFTKTQTVTAALIYNDETWGVTAQIPYVDRTHGTYGQTAPLGSSYSSSYDSGIGDIKVLGRYTGYSETGASGIIAGLKLPTGSTAANFNAGTSVGQPLDAGLQIGTGSTDVILGGYTSSTIASYGWFAQGTVQHAIATKQALGNLDYRPGDSYSLNSGIRYAGFGAKISPMLQLNIIKRQADSGAVNAAGLGSVPIDPITGAPVSGGTLAYLAPGASMRLGGGASAYGFIQLPLYQNVSSLQLTPRYTYTLGVRQSF